MCRTHRVYLLTYSMVQSPSWEASWFAAGQEITRVLWNPKVPHRTHKRPHTQSLVPLILYYPNLFYLLTVGAEDYCSNWSHSNTHTHTHTRARARAFGRIPLDEWSARRRDLYLTTHNTHDRHPCPWWYSNP